MFSYAVTGNGSSVAQYRTNTTSLTVTGLSEGTMYHFAVAAVDANLTTGLWSEIVDILWDGINYTSNFMYNYSSNTCYSSKNGFKYLFDNEH